MVTVMVVNYGVIVNNGWLIMVTNGYCLRSLIIQVDNGQWWVSDGYNG